MASEVLVQARKEAASLYSNFSQPKQGAKSVFERLHMEIISHKVSIPLADSGGILRKAAGKEGKTQALSHLIIEHETLRRLMRLVEETDDESAAFRAVAAMQKKSEILGRAGADYFYGQPAQKNIYSLMFSDKLDFSIVRSLSDFCADLLPSGQFLSGEKKDHQLRNIYLLGSQVGVYRINEVSVPTENPRGYVFSQSVVPFDFKYGGEYSVFSALEFSLVFQEKHVRMGNSHSGRQTPIAHLSRMFKEKGLDFAKLKSELDAIAESNGAFLIQPSFYSFSICSQNDAKNALVPEATFTYKLPGKSGASEFVFSLFGDSLSVVHPDGYKRSGLEGHYSL